MVLGRALHFVFKVGDRARTVAFYRDVLGMVKLYAHNLQMFCTMLQCFNARGVALVKVLRHEEFEEGCKASCNGPYGNKWSKTMMGYGPEDSHFVSELTYNYGIGGYRKGNDFLGITIQSSEAVSNAKKQGWALTEDKDGMFVTEDPGGYKFILVNKEQPKADPVLKVTLAVSDLQRSIDYWSNLLGMKVYEKDDAKKQVLLGYADDQCKLELQDIGSPVNHASAYGRIAFSCPREQLPGIESQMKEENQKILTPLVSLDTPGKATVEVVILADPDGHEICFVGEEAFHDLSQVDATANKLLEDAIAEDKSVEWFAKYHVPKPSA